MYTIFSFCILYQFFFSQVLIFFSDYLLTFNIYMRPMKVEIIVKYIL